MDSVDLYRRWIEELWCGAVGVAEEVVADGFVGYWPARTVRGRGELVGLISSTHSMLGPLSFAVEVGPIAQGPLVAGRWRGRGWRDDEAVEFVGNDILRVADGKFVEYWVASVELPAAGEW
ncbi:nuclear transport factor 2 family protein [Saccharothrix obliqua]|uniref:nuclear transport factor 2 family protein n=1 Tax=Saccharothrix obliqua TaxID=2861747 RepID=UPI001C5D3CDC|nr:nuclear transport factor 2 family protein [Saccharothrix obliqua]MBW4715764.1 ester cyclase [Saccharothrix obliqua]